MKGWFEQYPGPTAFVLLALLVIVAVGGGFALDTYVFKPGAEQAQAEAKEAGREACRRGEGPGANPYHMRGGLQLSWLEGWAEEKQGKDKK